MCAWSQATIPTTPCRKPSNRILKLGFFILFFLTCKQYVNISMFLMMSGIFCRIVIQWYCIVLLSHLYMIQYWDITHFSDSVSLVLIGVLPFFSSLQKVNMKTWFKNQTWGSGDFNLNVIWMSCVSRLLTSHTTFLFSN